MAIRNLALLGLLALVVACGDDGPTPPQQGEASLRVYHASPNVGAVDVVLNGETLKTDVQYDDTVDYRTFATGAVDLQMRAAGTTTNVIQPVGGTSRPGENYTVLLAGRTGTTTGPTIRPIALTDNARPAAGAASVRAVHAAPGAGNVDFYFSAPDDDLAALTPVVRFGFGNATAYGDVILPGTYRVRLTPVNAKTPVIVDLPSVVIEAGQKVSLIAIGEGTAEQPFVIRVLVDR